MIDAEKRYSELFQAHVLAGDEAALASIAALGSELVQAGIPIEEIAGFHEKAFLALSSAPRTVPWSIVAQRSSACLTELMIAFSLAHREQTEQLEREHERERQHERERERIGRLESERQKLELIGRMAGGVAHEINNLLQPILGMAEMGQADIAADDPLQENLTIILDCARQAGTVVRGILTYVRQQTPKAHPIALGHVIAEHAAMVQSILLPGCRVELNLPDTDSLVLGDEGEVAQILLNLVQNACYAMDGKGTVLVELAKEKISDFLHLSVTDTGCGMSAEIAEQAFDPFYSTRPPGEGTGLGLSVVQGIVQDWGGSVRLDTAPGKGACIHIRLPLFPA